MIDSGLSSEDIAWYTTLDCVSKFSQTSTCKPSYLYSATSYMLYYSYLVFDGGITKSVVAHFDNTGTYFWSFEQEFSGAYHFVKQMSVVNGDLWLF